MSAAARVQRAIAMSLHRAPALLSNRALRARSPRDGHALDPTIALLLALEERAGLPKAPHVSVEEARRNFKLGLRAVRLPLDTSVETEGVQLAGLGVRVYRPAHAPRPAPGVVYFHGGGFVIGDLDTHDDVCRFLATTMGSVVLSVDYRLAPEHRYPQAAEDAFAAFQAVARETTRFGLDPARLAVAGDSAGGNLSAVVCLMGRDRAGAARPRAQGLLYPAVDLRRTFASHVTFAHGYFLDEPMISWFLGNYARPEQYTEPTASPLCASDHGGLPSAVVHTAGFDPLRDEGRAYADKLESAGVPVRYRCETTLPHGFANMAGAVPAAREALRTFALDLREALS